MSDIFMQSKLDENKCKLRIVLNNNVEFKRLTNLVAAKHNSYDSETEIVILDNLIFVLLTGYKSEEIISVEQIQKLHFLYSFKLL